jgi:hypothetical protein
MVLSLTFFLPRTTVQIPKGRNVNISDGANYHGIALSFIHGKIFDYIMLARYQDRMTSYEPQFGFKTISLTNLCTMVPQEIIGYDTRHDSPVFCTFLDATKAFNRLHYCNVNYFVCSLNANCRLTLLEYKLTYICIIWFMFLGATLNLIFFTALDGVKQGPVLSLVLFCVYIDDLLKLLSNDEIGCYMLFSHPRPLQSANSWHLR